MYQTQRNSANVHNCAVEAQVICATNSILYEKQINLIKGAIASLLVAVTIVATCMVS